jgi:hypothetical protein
VCTVSGLPTGPKNTAEKVLEPEEPDDWQPRYRTSVRSGKPGRLAVTWPRPAMYATSNWTGYAAGQPTSTLKMTDSQMVDPGASDTVRCETAGWWSRELTGPHGAHCHETSLSPRPATGYTGVTPVSVTAAEDAFDTSMPSSSRAPDCVEHDSMSCSTAGPAAASGIAGPGAGTGPLGVMIVVDGVGPAAGLAPPLVSRPAANPAPSPASSATAASTAPPRDGRQPGPPPALRARPGKPSQRGAAKLNRPDPGGPAPCSRMSSLSPDSS